MRYDNFRSVTKFNFLFVISAKLDIATWFNKFKIVNTIAIYQKMSIIINR